MKCKCCSFDAVGEVFKIREMFFGLREIFDYQKCSNCGCMQLVNIPANLSKYYPADNYYSFNTGEKDKKINTAILRKIKTSYILYGKNKLVGSLLSIGYKIPSSFAWLKAANVGFNDAILDVGCGDGGLLASLCKNGFTNLTGIDPYIPNDQDYGGFKIYKKELFEIEGKYDFIMLNHVFEHIDNPGEMLAKLFQLLNPGKVLLIRTPVMDNYLWKKYGENWIGLDAPRHLIIHSVKSMQLLSAGAGFSMDKIVFDGTANNIIGSEQYKRDIPLTDVNSRVINKKSTSFTAKEIEAYQIMADQANRNRDGDQATFYLHKALQ